MELGAIFVGLAMLMASVPFLSRPFQEKRLKKDQKPAIRLNPDEGRLAVLSALRELDFDFRTGKVGEEDYLPLRAQLLAEAATYIQSGTITTIQDEQLEVLISARKASQLKVQECSDCGKKIPADSSFCPQCGSAVGHNCPSCGKAVQAGDLFCIACGTKLEREMAPAV